MFKDQIYKVLLLKISDLVLYLVYDPLFQRETFLWRSIIFAVNP